MHLYGYSSCTYISTYKQESGFFPIYGPISLYRTFGMFQYLRLQILSEMFEPYLDGKRRARRFQRGIVRLQQSSFSLHFDSSLFAVLHTAVQGIAYYKNRRRRKVLGHTTFRTRAKTLCNSMWICLLPVNSMEGCHRRTRELRTVGELSSLGARATPASTRRASEA